MENIQNFTAQSYDDSSTLLITLLNFCLCVAAGFLVRFFYLKRAYSISGKKHISSIIPILSGIVFIVIIVVKSSLALSLGLVGALSIVRFRTPVKEPEDLAYLFLAIAVGIGYGAGHVAMTTMLMAVLLAVIHICLPKNTESAAEFNLIIDWKKTGIHFSDMEQKFSPLLDDVQLIRLEQGEDSNRAVLQVSIKEKTKINNVIRIVRELDQSSTVTFFEANTNL